MFDEMMATSTKRTTTLDPKLSDVPVVIPYWSRINFNISKNVIKNVSNITKNIFNPSIFNKTTLLTENIKTPTKDCNFVKIILLSVLIPLTFIFVFIILIYQIAKFIKKRNSNNLSTIEMQAINNDQQSLV